LCLAKVLNPYIEYRKKAVAIINKERSEELAKPKEITPEQAKELEHRFDYRIIVTAFYDYFKTGKLDLGIAPVNYVYEQIETRHKLVTEPNDKKRERYNRVSENLAEILSKKRQDDESKTGVEFRKNVRKILSGGDEYSRSEAIKEICREEIIMEIFEDINRSNKSIEEALGVDAWVKQMKKNEKR